MSPTPLAEHSGMIGYQILKRIEFPWPIANMVRQHHEAYDDNGYPDGLKNNETMPEALILRVIDTAEALRRIIPIG